MLFISLGLGHLKLIPILHMDGEDDSVGRKNEMK
jgi:hypothetical protein